MNKEIRKKKVLELLTRKKRGKSDGKRKVVERYYEERGDNKGWVIIKRMYF
jgi:hypothetical protein